jgi:membrane peptidoglycan carboxypeptidase
MPVYPSFILGTEEIAPLTMASAYAAFAQSGTWCQPLAISEVKNSAGEVIAQPKPDCSQAISKEVADGVAHALSNTLDRGTAACCDISWPAAGKTGTTNDSTETWFVGFTRQLSTAVWVGTPDKRPTSLNGQTLNGKRYHRVYGATVAAPTWRAYMNSAMDGLARESFPAVATRLIRNPYPPPEATSTSRPSHTGGSRGDDDAGRGNRGGNGGGRGDGGGDDGGGRGGGEDNGGPPTQGAEPND